MDKAEKISWIVVIIMVMAMILVGFFAYTSSSQAREVCKGMGYEKVKFVRFTDYFNCCKVGIVEGAYSGEVCVTGGER